jgi:nucleotide-binding universal stress UspA family protein
MKALETRTRVEIGNVLFPTDFSPAADAAIPYVAEIVRRFGARLHALHVRPPVINPMTEPATWPVLERVAMAEANAQRQALLAAFPRIKPEVMIEEGDFWQILKSTIEKQSIDLIVLGTRGRSGAAKFFLGSKAEQIFREVPCAVLTIGPNLDAKPSRGGEFTEILYATDFSPASAGAAAYAISLAQEFQAHLTLLHVIPEEKSGDLVQAAELMGSTGRLLRKLVPPEAEMWCEPHFAVERGPAAEKILEVAKQRKADLIVLGVRRPSGFPGAATHLPIATAHKIVTHATCPVLTVRG